ncbi:MAG TPA: ABC transporter permease [Vicinamibacterales bacterium]|nr:ABC transporter permease [Vicinamibacterales bacterium]
MISDLRFAWRALWKSPTTTLGAMLALALGIGATTAMFGLLSAVALRPLPYPESDRLVELWGNVERQVVERRGTSIPDYLDWKAKTTSFDRFSAWGDSGFIMYGAGAPERISGEVVAGDYFGVLGVEPIIGRALTSADDAGDAPLVAVIGEELWSRAYSRAQDAVGKSIRLNNQVFTIVGVAPAKFKGRSDASEVWVSMIASVPPQVRAQRGNRGFPALARIAPGVSLAQAQADATNVAKQLEQAYPATNEKRGIEVASLANEVFGAIRPAISLLFGAVAFVLVIACASVASLLLARTESRRREFSLRRAIGADERRLIRLMLSESAWVVALGGTMGVLLSMWAGDALLALSPVQLPSFAAPGIDWRTLGFVVGLGVLITVVIGLSPLRSMRKHSLAHDLREGAIEARGGTSGRTLQAIVAVQIAVTVTLLVGAALFGRSFAALAKFDPGFEPAGVLTMRVQLPLVAGAQPPAPAQGQGVDAGAPALALLDDLRGLPGVTDAALASAIPLGGQNAIFYSAEGMGAVDATNRPRAYLNRVSPGYVETIGLHLIEGRAFGPTDLGANAANVMVTQAMVERFWPGQSAIGRRIKNGDLTSENPWWTIVGVLQDANLRGIPVNPTRDPDIFLPFNERSRGFAVLIKTTGDPSLLIKPATEVMRRVDAGVAVFTPQPLSTLVDEQLASSRFLTWLTGVFAATALTLAIIGIYGLLAYWVGQRTREIGVRAALGANRGQLMGLVVSQGLTLALIGVVAGGVAAAVLGRFVETQLYSVQPLDIVSFAVTAGVMIATAFIASVVPALRTLRIDPINALRGE